MRSDYIMCMPNMYKRRKVPHPHPKQRNTPIVHVTQMPTTPTNKQLPDTWMPSFVCVPSTWFLLIIVGDYNLLLSKLHKSRCRVSSDVSQRQGEEGVGHSTLLPSLTPSHSSLFPLPLLPHSPTHSLTHSLTYSLTHPLTHSPTQPLTPLCYV